MHVLKNLLRHVLLFGAGLFGGMLLSQCLMVLCAREGSSFGGEAFTLLALPLLVAVSFSIGYDVRGVYTRAKKADAEMEQDDE